MKKISKWLGIILGILLSLWLLIYLWPAKKRPERAFYRKDDEEVLVIAHRGGKGLAPEGTLAAFENADELGVDMFEFDIHMTKDEHLVVIHDDTVDRTTDGSGKVNEMSLEEIQSLDAGYYFKDDK